MMNSSDLGKLQIQLLGQSLTMICGGAVFWFETLLINRSQQATVSNTLAMTIIRAAVGGQTADLLMLVPSVVTGTHRLIAQLTKLLV